ncbi:MAG: hypothetical protein GY785_14980, partial [Gammaproteobacteria bacterium]|nr:hypothetical protein [Gammaproteobacteria bacterium]
SSDNPVSFNDVVATLGDNGYGNFEITGNTWTFTLNNAHASVQALGAGASLTDSFTFSASDGSIRNVMVTINGADDAAVISGTASGEVSEDVDVVAGSIADSGQLSVTDPDAGESGFRAQTISGSFGELSIDASGNWQYSADNSQPEFQALQAGDVVTETLTVTSTGGTTHDIVITINGADEAPPPLPPPVIEPPVVEPPPEPEVPPPEEETTPEEGGGDESSLDEIVRVPQSVIVPPAEPEESGFAQVDEPDHTEPVNYGPVIENQTVDVPAPQPLQLRVDELRLQVSDDEFLNEQYELELLNRIDRMHEGMDSELSNQKADDVEVQIVMGSTASLTVGIVSWVLRGGSLLASFMSTVPLLNRFDPLPILKTREDEEDLEPDEDTDTEGNAHAKKVDKMFSAKDGARR